MEVSVFVVEVELGVEAELVVDEESVVDAKLTFITHPFLVTLWSVTKIR